MMKKNHNEVNLRDFRWRIFLSLITFTRDNNNGFYGSYLHPHIYIPFRFV